MKINCHGKGSHAFRETQLSKLDQHGKVVMKPDQHGKPVISKTFCANHESMCNFHGIAYEKGSRKGCPACDKEKKTIGDKGHKFQNAWIKPHDTTKSETSMDRGREGPTVSTDQILC